MSASVDGNVVINLTTLLCMSAGNCVVMGTSWRGRRVAAVTRGCHEQKGPLGSPARKGHGLLIDCKRDQLIESRISGAKRKALRVSALMPSAASAVIGLRLRCVEPDGLTNVRSTRFIRRSQTGWL